VVDKLVSNGFLKLTISSSPMAKLVVMLVLVSEHLSLSDLTVLWPLKDEYDSPRIKEDQVCLSRQVIMAY
jgi:hypothetical protein